MKCCPTCGQTLPEPAPAGVRLSPLKTKIFERVRRAGPNGISTRDLWDLIYANDADGGPISLKVLAVHINQLNKQLRPLGKRIWAGQGGAASFSGPGSGVYVLENL